jgi:hypothetical protein
MINESLTIGLLLAVVFGGICFYLYTRVIYTEKRISLMENILLDIKMGQEQKPLHVLPPIPNEVSFEDTLDRNQYTNQYTNQETNQNTNQETNLNEEETLFEPLEEVPNFENEEDTQEYTELLNQVSAETLAPQQTVKNNYDNMTKDELLELVKKRGLRAGNRPGREKLISLLEKADETSPPLEAGSFTDLQEAVSE